MTPFGILSEAETATSRPLRCPTQKMISRRDASYARQRLLAEAVACRGGKKVVFLLEYMHRNEMVAGWPGQLQCLRGGGMGQQRGYLVLEMEMREACEYQGGLCLDSLLAEHLGPEDGVLAGHAAGEGAVKLCAQRQLAHVVGLLVGELVSLLDEAAVLEALEAGVPRLDVLGLWVAGS